MKNVYFDNNATTHVAPEVLEAMEPFYSSLYGNPSSMHAFGGQVRRHIEKAREQVAALIGAEPSEIVFTGCGTESDNMAIRGSLEAADKPMKIVTTRVEHPAVLETCRIMRERANELVELGVDSGGRLDMDELNQALSGERLLASIMWANNETGVIFPMNEIAERVKAAGGILHTDAVQAVGKVPIDLSSIPVDLLSLSGHKLHAPKGVGALFIRKGTRVNPLLFGGHQEAGKRGGTENVPGIVGLGRACELAAEHMNDETTLVRRLRDRLEKGIIERCPDSQVNGERENRLSNTLNVSFMFIEGESILYHLSDLGIAAASGSACASGSLEPSHVIRAMGVPFIAAHGSIRFSLSRYNTEQEVDYVLEHLPGIVETLRAISPFANA